jgi:hypothetical protein
MWPSNLSLLPTERQASAVVMWRGALRLVYDDAVHKEIA